MAQPHSRPVPHDTWVCGNCDAPNIIANADQRCPTCGHMRDYQQGCCANPGEHAGRSGLFPNDPELHFPQHFDAQDSCSLGYSIPTAMTGDLDQPLIQYGEFDDMPYTASPDINEAGAGSVGDGTWVCSECGCPNSDIHDACGACGVPR